MPEEKKEKKKEKMMTFIMATNVIAGRPPEHQPTGTPTNHAKNRIKPDLLVICCWFEDTQL